MSVYVVNGSGAYLVTTKDTAWSVSIGGSPIGGGPNGAELERAKSAETGKYSVGVPTLDEHFSSSARQILPKFSASLEEGAPVEGRKNSGI